MRVCNVVTEDFKAVIGEVVKFVHKHPHAIVKNVDAEKGIIRLEVAAFNKKDWSYEEDLGMDGEQLADAFCIDINNFLHFNSNVEQHECLDISE